MLQLQLRTTGVVAGISVLTGEGWNLLLVRSGAVGLTQQPQLFLCHGGTRAGAWIAIKACGEAVLADAFRTWA